MHEDACGGVRVFVWVHPVTGYGTALLVAHRLRCRLIVYKPCGL